MDYPTTAGPRLFNTTETHITTSVATATAIIHHSLQCCIIHSTQHVRSCPY